MKIITEKYESRNGYLDIAPGYSAMNLFLDKTATGKVICCQSAEVSSQFNEIQTSGSKELRLSLLPKGDDGSSILFMDDENYDALLYRRACISTKNIPLEKSDEFVRCWLAMSIGQQEILEVGSTTPHWDNKGWGHIDDLNIKKDMLDNISNMAKPVRERLKDIHGNPQFISDYLIWRSSIKGRIKYKHSE